jgi:hypothetical protein
VVLLDSFLCKDRRANQFSSSTLAGFFLGIFWFSDQLMEDIFVEGIWRLYTSTGEVDGGEGFVERDVKVVVNVEGERKVEAS